MSPTRALLAFPLQPAEALAALEGRRAAWLAPLAPAAALAVYLLARGCGAGDAAVAGLSLLILLCGLGAGGALASYPASFVTGASFSPAGRAGPCLVFAAWTAVLFVLLLVAVRLLGAGSEAALVTAVILLVWGGVAGSSMVGGEQAADFGRSMVGSCIGLAGALLGLWGALFLVQAQLLLVVPSMATTDQFETGDPLLVRVGAPARRGDIVLMRATGSREAVLASFHAKSPMEPLGDVDRRVWSSRKWDTAGRVFFRFGGSLGGSVVLARHRR